MDVEKRDAIIKSNYDSVIHDVRSAARRSGRDEDSVTIVGVTKYVDADTTLSLTRAGCRDLGENRPQQLWKKNEQVSFPEETRWHLIGHLQRNKVRRLLSHAPMIHSIDSRRLLQAVADEAVGQERTIDILLEVNISGDEAKTGMSPGDLEHLLDNRPENGVDILGLMAMAGWGTEGKNAQKQFEQTRELRDRLSAKCGLQLGELSMGMSGDYAQAIIEGATIVRIGSRLFEGVRE